MVCSTETWQKTGSCSKLSHPPVLFTKSFKVNHKNLQFSVLPLQRETRSLEEPHWSDDLINAILPLNLGENSSSLHCFIYWVAKVAGLPGSMSKAEIQALALGMSHRWEWFWCGDVLSRNETDLMLVWWVRGTEVAGWPPSFAAAFLAVAGTLRLSPGCLTKLRREFKSFLKLSPDPSVCLEGSRLPAQVCRQGYFKLTGSYLSQNLPGNWGLPWQGLRAAKPPVSPRTSADPKWQKAGGKVTHFPVPPTSFCACLSEN